MKKKILIFGGLGLSIIIIVINWIYGKAKLVSTNESQFGNPLAFLTIRNDSQGNGGFWKSRLGGKYHEGTDLLSAKGEKVFSPISGTITRKAYPYASDKRFEGCVIYDDATKTEVKLFYMVCTKVGSKVNKGEQIGTCQAINEKYGSSMKNHLHIEIRVAGTLVNPEEIYKQSIQ